IPLGYSTGPLEKGAQDAAPERSNLQPATGVFYCVRRSLPHLGGDDGRAVGAPITIILRSVIIPRICHKDRSVHRRKEYTRSKLIVLTGKKTKNRDIGSEQS